MAYHFPNNLKGLTEEQVVDSRQEYGINKLVEITSDSWYILILKILKEPMLLLLIAVMTIYFIVGDIGEAIFMLVAIVAVTGIEVYQDNRSKKALTELEKLNEPLSAVIRNSKAIKIPTHEIVVGDLCVIEEGKLINADGTIVHSNDFSVNESSLTGESLSVFKDKDTKDNQVYSGTIVVSGLAVFKVANIGAETKIGKIGSSLQNIKEEPSPLQVQITQFVKLMAIIGIIIFLMVWGYSYYQSGKFIDSLLNGLTLAMSILPEEIPVAFSTFMALGAWKLMKEGIIIKRSSIVETLGSTTVICTDKTGTITENAMHLKYLFDCKENKVYQEQDFKNERLNSLIQYAMWSSEPIPFDPMEKELHKIYAHTQKNDLRSFHQLVHEYPLSGTPPMMVHIFKDKEGKSIVAAKGAPEAVIQASKLSVTDEEHIFKVIKEYGSKGFRILGVAKASFDGDQYPDSKTEFNFEFLGLLFFYDPPKKGINNVVQQIYDAGVQLKVITGDNGETTNAIAQQSGIINATPILTGNDIIELSEEKLMATAANTTLFSRMFPQAKLLVVNALKKSGAIVAMLGDGVNDAPALKSAHIGVAMGTKGTEIAKAAADLVITNDNLEKLIVGIAAGRRIYSNLKKAIQYIISIHIPIILTVSLPLFLGWIYPQIFTPVHVIFLELVMGPTCSIVYENEPLEKNTMLQAPRKITDTFLNWKELSISILQGVMITLGVLFAYQWMVQNGGNEAQTRTMVFTTLIFSNIFLSLVNRSFHYSIIETLQYKNRLMMLINIAVLVILFIMLFVPPVTQFFRLETLHFTEIGIALSIAAVAVLWFEVYKLIKRLC